MNIFNGERPGLVSTAARRSVDISTPYAECFPELVEKVQSLEKSGFKITQDYFKSKRGLSLGTKTLEPPENLSNDCGIIFCHGYCDSLRWMNSDYQVRFAEHNYLVTGMEFEGHGLSDSTSGFFTDMNLVVQDLHEFIAQEQDKHSGIKKWFLFGESMGGMIAIMESMKAQDDRGVKIDGMILLAPMCKIADKVRPSAPMIKLLQVISKWFPKLSIIPTAFSDKLIFKTEKVRRQQNKDPIRYIGRPRLATANAMFLSTVELEKNLDKVKTPFFVLHGKKDVVTPCEASQDLFDKSILVNKEDKKILLPEDGWHALLHSEPQDLMEDWWHQIFTWLDSRKEIE